MKHATVLSAVKEMTRCARQRFLLMVPILALFLLPACSWLGPGDSVVIPQEETARDQARVAELQYRRATQTVDEQIRREEFLKAIKALDAVGQRFPDDRVYTPAAQLLKAQTYYDMRDYAGAEREYRRTVERYPDVEDVHASALFGLGNSLYELGRIREGQKYFRQLQDQYAASKSPVVKQLVERAISKSREIRTERKI
ncbi:tetratricopeptide repeat protein [Candidatus Sumerlaeota bacterium]|nr:tetratricopeptide repeat protein [Candidatus Sumerlaeota bacterium]